MSGADQLAEAHAAVERGAWQLALDVLADGGPDGGGAEGLELRAQAAYGNGEFEAAVSAWEDLHSLSSPAGDDDSAARAAAMIAMYLMMDTGLMAPGARVATARRAVAGGARRGLGPRRDRDGSHLRACSCAATWMGRGTQSALAIELGGRLGVAPAVVIGRVAAARVRIFDGHVDEGLELLDEIGVLLMSGEVDPLTTGMMYCELICAAQGLARHDRASEWTEVMERWRHGAAFGGINGRCRVHRAELLRISGPCDLAEAEALGACEELRPWMRREFGWPLVELGNIRLRRGDLAGAEEAYVAADEHAWSPFPGLALLRLAQGDVESASAFIADAIAHPFATPSKERPPFGDLRLAPLLDAQAEIAAAAGDVDTARRAADRWQSIADSYRSRAFDASAALADGQGGAARWRPRPGDRWVWTAIETWAAIGAPFETARRPHGARRSPSPIGQPRSGTNGVAGSPRSIRSVRCVAMGASEQNIASPEPLPSRPRHRRGGGDGDVQMRRRHEDHLLRGTHRPHA